jgi:hypothetical protein
MRYDRVQRSVSFLPAIGNFSSFASVHLLGTSLVRRKSLLGFILCWCVWLVPQVQAETYQLLDGTSVTGEAVLPARPEGVNIRTAPSTYQFVGWTNFTQAALQELAKNDKIAPFAEAFIEITDEERLKKTDIGEKVIPPRLERPPNGSLLGALLHSSVGIFTLFLIYAANVYAGYEIAVVRAYPPAMVCGISAVAPVIGPVIFLCLPTRMETPAEAASEPAPTEPTTLDHGSMADAPTGVASSTLHIAHEEAATATARPETQVFKRGQFTFNRRFVETKFSGFFGLVRREAEKDLVFLLKSSRGEFTVSRITRIAANDMHVEIRKGAATSEVQIPFVEIQEIHLKHKDA